MYYRLKQPHLKPMSWNFQKPRALPITLAASISGDRATQRITQTRTDAMIQPKNPPQDHIDPLAMPWMPHMTSERTNSPCTMDLRVFMLKGYDRKPPSQGICLVRVLLTQALGFVPWVVDGVAVTCEVVPCVFVGIMY